MKGINSAIESQDEAKNLKAISMYLNFLQKPV